MNHAPRPVVVAQSQTRSLPRWVLWLVCSLYVLAGFVGRDPWKSRDLAAFGSIVDTNATLQAGGATAWLAWLAQLSQVFSTSAELGLAAALGSLSQTVFAPLIGEVHAARLPFAIALLAALICTWYAGYYLARQPLAQPVSFAFGGEADHISYARTVGDAALLALVATLGLAQLGHEATGTTLQLGFAALCLLGMAMRPFRAKRGAFFTAAGLVGLVASGALEFVVAHFVIGSALRAMQHQTAAYAWRHWLQQYERIAPASLLGKRIFGMLLAIGLMVLLPYAFQEITAFLSQSGGPAGTTGTWSWPRFGRLLVWFCWPALPLALLGLWHWRRQLKHYHLRTPLIGLLAAAGVIFAGLGYERTLLLALPSLALLAAFALPTIKRSISAMLDWMTLLFFTAALAFLWAYWLSLETGIMSQLARNVYRRLEGFEPALLGESAAANVAFLVALLTTGAWVMVVVWRVGRHPKALWKSLALPAAGTLACWTLLMTLHLPLFNYARSYQPLAEQIALQLERLHFEEIQPTTRICVDVSYLSPAAQAGLRLHLTALDYPVQNRTSEAQASIRALNPADDRCPLVLSDAYARNKSSVQARPSAAQRNLLTLQRIQRPGDKGEAVLLHIDTAIWRGVYLD